MIRFANVMGNKVLGLMTLPDWEVPQDAQPGCCFVRLNPGQLCDIGWCATQASIPPAGPMASTPIVAAPVDAEPVDAEPVDAEPVDAAPVDAAPVDIAPVDIAPVDIAPVDAAPVDAAPVDVAPVDVAPVDAAPVDVAPVIVWTFNPPPPVISRGVFKFLWPEGAIDAIGAATEPKVAQAWQMLAEFDAIDLGLTSVQRLIAGCMTYLVSANVVKSDDVAAATARIMAGRID